MAEYIERGALMKNFCGYDLTRCVKYGNKDADQRHNSYSTMMMYEIADEIMDAPSADVAPVRHGRWKLFRAGDWTTVYECSVCKRRVPVSGDKGKANERVMKRYPYCNCGERMVNEF